MKDQYNVTISLSNSRETDPFLRLLIQMENEDVVCPKNIGVKRPLRFKIEVHLLNLLAENRISMLYDMTFPPISGPRGQRLSDLCVCHCTLSCTSVRWLREADPHCTPVSKPASSPKHPSNPRTSARSSTPLERSREMTHWRPYRLGCHKVVIVDGRCFHSQHITADQYTEAFRVNQVLYLSQKPKP